MSQLQDNTGGIVAAFYTGTQNCSPLSREELRQLMEQEFGDALENPQDPQSIQKVLCFLADENNCRVGFRELLRLVFHVAKACYKPLQQHQELGDGPGLRGHAEGRVPPSQQVPEHGGDNQDQDMGTQDQDTPQSREGETPEQDSPQIQEGETPEQDTPQIQEGETPEQAPSEDPEQDTPQIQEGETPEQDQDTPQIQEGETPEQDQGTPQIQEGETPEQDQDTPWGHGAEAPGGDPEGGEILDTATPEQDRDTCEAEEAEEATKQDPKTHQTPETEAPGEGSKHHQSPEAAKQDLNPPSETRGQDPQRVCEAPWKAPNPGQTPELLPPQWGASPQQDAKAQGTPHEPDWHRIPGSKALGTEHSQGPYKSSRVLPWPRTAPRESRSVPPLAWVSPSL
ncbi:cornulin-like [Chiroxiphia lanceolata]|uniref:cornulin-like n=1 Tax=Chiroxiphia lanceolata TaxID=296741 RepID=UPI0013CE56E2|nr:cornulin-like [Chiroxiphia lanceolata]